MDPSSSGLRRAGPPQDAESDAQPNKARRLTADSSTTPHGSLSHSATTSPSPPGGTPATLLFGSGSAAGGNTTLEGGLQHLLPYQYGQAGREAAGMGLDGGHEGQRLEVALDDGGDDQHLHCTDREAAAAAAGIGDAAGADGANGGPGREPEQEAAAEGPVTETIAAGMVGMRQRRAAIEQQIDELTNVALEYLEAMKKDFVERMARLKGNVAVFCNGQENEWRETNATTQEALGRLVAARSLVRSLGLNANPTGGQGEAGLFGGGGEDGFGGMGGGGDDGSGLGGGVSDGQGGLRLGGAGGSGIGGI